MRLNEMGKMVKLLNHHHTQISHVRMKHKEIYACGVWKFDWILNLFSSILTRHRGKK